MPTSPIPSDQRTGVRLSLPSFVQPESGLPGMLEDRPSSDQTRLAVQPPQPSSAGQLGFTADQLRQFMNERSQNPMTSGQLLADKQPKWKVLATGSGHSQLSNRSSTTTSSAQASADVRPDRQNTPQIRQISNTSEGQVKQLTWNQLPADQGGDSSGAVEATEVSAEQPFPTATDSEFAFRPAVPSQDVAGNVANVEQDAVSGVAPQVTPTDDSMLSRLKGLYDPSEDGVARKIWKRQIPRLPNPWNVFKDKSEAALQSAEDFVENAEAEITAAINPETPTPAPVVTSETASSLLAQLVQEYELRLESWPRTPAERPEALPEYQKLQQELRLLYLLQDRPEEAASAIEMISPSQQQFWQSLILSLAEYREAGASSNPSTHFTGSLHQLRSAAHALSPLADLRIRRMDICSRILSYGRIEAFPSNDFDPGRPLLLYVELENFGTQTTQTGHYLASFDATLQIFEKGKDTPRETIRLTDITDESTSVRTDYFQSYDLTLPSHLMAGEYEIRLKLRDKVTGKIARAKVAFQVR